MRLYKEVYKLPSMQNEILGFLFYKLKKKDLSVFLVGYCFIDIDSFILLGFTKSFNLIYRQ